MDELQSARDCALRIVARRDHSVAELKRKLVQRSFSPEVIESVLQSFFDSGYLDDRRYAARWIESAIASGRGFGPRLKTELARRGIDRQVANEVVAAQTRELDEGEALRSFVAKRFHSFDPHNADDREKRRVFGFLQRRGFSTSAIMALFRESLHED